MEAGGSRIPACEIPARIASILDELYRQKWAEILAPSDFGLEPILSVHSRDYVDYLEKAFAGWLSELREANVASRNETPVLVPTWFPSRRSCGKPESFFGRAGYYSSDLNAPITEGTFDAAYAAAQCAISGAQVIACGEAVAFALCRPPGHHAGRDYSAGFCYLNNASIAARFLASSGSVAVIDIDYHAGNGTQDIFYDSSEVLTVSLHADPLCSYPYFSGFPDESGSGSGKGFHLNVPLPAHTGDKEYILSLEKAIALVREFDPRTIVVSLGLDISAGDPMGDLSISPEGFAGIGAAIEGISKPTLIVLEGGYDTQTLGRNTISFLACFLRDG